MTSWKYILYFNFYVIPLPASPETDTYLGVFAPTPWTTGQNEFSWKIKIIMLRTGGE